MKTVSLELSKQLKEAGYPQTDDDAFGCYMRDTRLSNESLKFYYFDPDYVDRPEYELYASPTADEILDQLPSKIDEFVFKVLKGNTGSYCIVYSNNHDVKRHICWYPNLADACAKMWLYLKKEGLL